MADRSKVLTIIEQALRDEFGASANYYRTPEKIIARGGEKLIPPTHGAYVLTCGDAAHGIGVDFVTFDLAVSHVILSQYFEGIIEERITKGDALLDFLTGLVRPGQWVTVDEVPYHTTDYLLEVLSWRIPPPFERAADMDVPGMASESGVYFRWATVGVTFQLSPSF